ncbi:MAG: hypothetical protein Q8P49_00255 [Candidatus Liptonbacteria bacterium]|nr:hypothetical protein [Candidatus Liptonbacteria bacterium]
MSRPSKKENFGEKPLGDSRPKREDRVLRGHDEMSLVLLEAAKQELEKQAQGEGASPLVLGRLGLVDKKIKIIEKITAERDPETLAKLKKELTDLDGGLDPIVAWEFGEDFNQKHPELLPGEKFYTNISSDKLESFSALPIASKRLGDKAYARDGTLLENCRPVFVERSEFENLDMKNKLPRKEPGKTNWIN